MKHTEKKETRTVVVIGGGIAGLTTAYYLRKHGIRVTLVEKEQAVGGVMRTALKENDRYLVEYGPNTFPASARDVVGLARELSIDSHIIRARVPEKRYVVRRQKLALVPKGPLSFLTSHALSPWGKCRLLCEPFIHSRAQEDESLAAFFRRRAGNEVLEGLVDPFVSGVYAGDPEQLSTRSVFPLLLEFEETYGSVLKGLMKQSHLPRAGGLLSFRWGMGTLPARLEEVLRHHVETGVSIESVTRLPDGQLSVRVEAPHRTLEADAVVLATPAWVTARILAPMIPAAIAPLMGIPYAPLVVCHTAFARHMVASSLNGFGFLVPRRERMRLLGSIFSSSLFEGRAPADMVLFTSFLGGAIDARAIELEDHEVVSYVTDALEKTLALSHEPNFVSIRRIAQAIPQYTIGHADRLRAVAHAVSEHPGVFLTGNYLHGTSVASTIKHARLVADDVLAHLGVWSPKGGGSE